MNRLPFRVDGSVDRARAGTLTVRGRDVLTPTYMPVGTQGAVRSVSPLHLQQTESQIVLANTYHLAQRPGEDLVARHGGLHTMMGIDLPILTDSGGFQVFSLDKEVTEEGVTFRYEVDGKKTFLSPERSMEIQQKLGADIAMVFDECLAYGTERRYAEPSVDRTTRWEARCREAHTRPDQALFGIVQGGVLATIYAQSPAAEQLIEIGFDGLCGGGAVRG